MLIKIYTKNKNKFKIIHNKRIKNTKRKVMNNKSKKNKNKIFNISKKNNSKMINKYMSIQWYNNLNKTLKRI